MLWAESWVFCVPDMSRDDSSSFTGPKMQVRVGGWEGPEEPPVGLGPAVLISERRVSAL